MDMIKNGYRYAKRLVILVMGLTVLLAGIAMLVLPGPALLVIPLGLAILAIEFAWARRWLNRLRETMRKAQQKVQRNNARNPEE